MFVADWLELQHNKKTGKPVSAFTDGYWRGEKGINCVPSGHVLAQLPDYHWSKVNVDFITDEEIEDFVGKRSVLSDLFKFIDDFEQGDWLEHLENYYVWNEVRKTPYEIMSLKEMAKDQKVEVMDDFSRAHLESPLRPVPEGGAQLLQIEKEAEKIARQKEVERQKAWVKGIESIKFPQAYEGKYSQKPEKTWSCIRRYCAGRNLPDDESFAHSLMFAADCLLIDSTRTEKWKNSTFESFTDGEWTYTVGLDECNPPLDYGSIDNWEYISSDKYSDAELDSFLEEYPILQQLLDYVDGLTVVEWEEFLDGVKIWNTLKQNKQKITNIYEAALESHRLISLPDEITTLSGRSVDNKSLSEEFYGPAKVYGFQDKDLWTGKSEESDPKRAGGQICTP